MVGVTLDAGGIDEASIIVCGLCVVSSDQFTGGTAPDVLADGSSDDESWIWQGSLYVSSGAQAAVVNEGLFDRIVIDSKAMRKLKPSEVIAFVHQSPSNLARGQGGTYDLIWYAHLLIGA